MSETQTKIDTRLWNLQDMIRGLGFTPEEHAPTTYREDWYIRPVAGGTQNVRIVVHPDDANAVDIRYMDRHFVTEWLASFDGSAPHSVIRAAIRAAIHR